MCLLQSVLQCDVDAVMIQNPIPLLEAVPGHVVAQRGGFPRREAAAWGATMCFGFILYRAHHATLSMLDLSLPFLAMHKDDQAATHIMLHRCSDVIWNEGKRFPTHASDLNPFPVGFTDGLDVIYFLYRLAQKILILARADTQ
eukprot:m.98299 g.98299  ORF g.98299 m.98299 type:complete len:143 (+) comp13629_c0_seq8:623-1051(+)